MADETKPSMWRDNQNWQIKENTMPDIIPDWAYVAISVLIGPDSALAKILVSLSYIGSGQPYSRTEPADRYKERLALHWGIEILQISCIA